MSDTRDFTVVSSGVDGLDSLLNGGYIAGRMYLARGDPGAGKSLLGQHFLANGLQNGETVVYIHGEETEASIIRNAQELQIDLEDAEFLDLGPETDFFTEDISYELVDPSDIESERFIDDIKNVIDGYDPDRIFLDPITQLRDIETDVYQYRKRILSLIRFLRERETTVLASRTRSQTAIDDEIESLTDGVIDLYRRQGGRRIEVPKHRGLGQLDGTHGLEIRDNGVEVYPQLTPTHEDRQFDPTLLSSGDPEFDTLLGGGIERGSVSFFSGPTGVGKSTTATQFVNATARRGETAVIYLFEENVDEFMYRAENVGIPMADLREEGSVIVREIEPLLRSAEEVGQMIQRDVEQHDPEVVMLDGISGYRVSLQGDESRLTDRIHALTRSLKNRGIAVLIMDEMSHLTGIPKATSEDTSYIADNVIILSYLEQTGGLIRVIGVLKKRIGNFESQFREFTITPGDGVVVGEPLDEIRGILQGTPEEGR